jgi:cytochrome b pre-mRNA-processing protein 3
MLNLLKARTARKQDNARLYDALVSRSREPVFFATFGVADNMDGRFDVLAFHAWMVLTELKGGPGAQSLTNTIFTGFDEAMREQGAGDIGIGHRLKSMAKAFYGRMKVYDAAAGEDELAAALAHNLWRGASPDDRARRLAAYGSTARRHLANSLPGALDFGPLPTL